MRKATSPKNAHFRKTGAKSNVVIANRVRVSQSLQSQITDSFSVGHGKGRCPEPPKEEGGAGDFGNANGGGGFDNGGFDTGAGAGEEPWNSGGDGAAKADWETAPTPTPVMAGGW